MAGRHLGHRLGFPTANLYFPAGRLIPAHGVYATRVYTPDGVFPGVSNVGVRPTVDGSAHPRPNCETYVIGFSGNLYGRSIRVDFGAEIFRSGRIACRHRAGRGTGGGAGAA